MLIDLQANASYAAMFAAALSEAQAVGAPTFPVNANVVRHFHPPQSDAVMGAGGNMETQLFIGTVDPTAQLHQTIGLVGFDVPGGWATLAGPVAFQPFWYLDVTGHIRRVVPAIDFAPFSDRNVHLIFVGNGIYYALSVNSRQAGLVL